MTAALHDPGGKTRLPLLPGVDGRAEFSPCGRYRYWLARDWGFRRYTDGREPYALWIGMNPSTAEADVDDPTIRREMAFTKAMGLDFYLKVNVMDYRATDPKALLAPGIVPCSDENLNCITGVAPGAARIVLAWGALPKRLQCYADRVLVALRDKPLFCMGKTASGNPRHPLYLRGDTAPMPFLLAEQPSYRFEAAQ
jgi:hypothetical protein